MTNLISKEHLENKIKLIQSQIQTQRPLPPVPMLPNLARGSEEMWQIYQYFRREYDQLMNLSSETEFLQELLFSNEWQKLVNERIKLLNRKAHASLPTLSQPTTSVRPLTYDDKVERAKLIAKHIKADRAESASFIKELQIKLMDLEEQYLAMDG